MSIEPRRLKMMPALRTGWPLSLTTLPLMVPGFDGSDEGCADEGCAIAGSQPSHNIAKTLTR